MAARYGQGDVGTVGTIANAQWDLWPQSSVRVKLYELGVFTTAATAATLGLGFASSTGTPTSGKAPLPYDTLDPTPKMRYHVTWSVQPGVPAVFLRHVALPATIGAGVIWRWPENNPLVITASQMLVLWNITAAGLCNIYFEAEE